MKYTVDKKGFYGNFGGAFVPEMLFPNLDELEKNYNKIINDSNNKPDKVIRTHRREMIIVPQFVGRKFGIYNGRDFVEIEIMPEMIGLYFGELAPTRTSPTHTGPGVGATKSSKFMPLKCYYERILRPIQPRNSRCSSRYWIECFT